MEKSLALQAFLHILYCSDLLYYPGKSLIALSIGQITSR